MQPIIAVQFRFALQFSILRIPHGMQRGNISILRIPCGVQRMLPLYAVRSRSLSILRIPCGVQLFLMRVKRRLSALSILRIPCGVQRARLWSVHTYQATFNLTHPLRGATVIGRGILDNYLSFNLTHPLRGATAILYITRIIFYVSLYIFTGMVYLTLWLRIYCIGFTLNNFYLLVRSFQ